ncbi:MAG: ligase ATP-dependent (dnl1) [Candidatus Angelobacter sp.]|nr:ligase ATP-dependent (dnl1) [Candidatus Angelobacter sp.]
MHSLAALCESISRTTRKNEKISLVAAYFQSNTVADSAIASIFLSGRAFPAYEETTLNIGGALLARVLLDITHATDHQLGLAYRRHGDLGSAAFDLFTEKNINAGAPSVAKPQVGTQAAPPITLQELESKFRDIAAASGPSKKADIVRRLFERSTPLEAKYLVKFMGGDLRIGLRESLVEEAIAKAYGEDASQVRRANMLLGDISAALRLAAEHRLPEAQMRLFHPIGLMLATPIENSAQALSYFKNTVIQIEDKYDGIRAQVHIGPDADSGATRVRIFSRTMDDITESFPELAESLRSFPFTSPVILDGEILAWDDLDKSNQAITEEGAPALSQSDRLGERVGGNGRALPFSRLQQRLGRKTPTPQLMRDVPVAYIAFDVIYANGELVIEKRLRERGAILQGLFVKIEGCHPAAQRRDLLFPKEATRKKTSAQHHLFEAPLATIAEPNPNSVPLPPILRAPIFTATTPEALDLLFDAAQARGNEGLMIKDLDSPYTPGRRGKSWLKLKRELATLDVVVTAVEYGHGKRAAVLSDYTFAVLDPSDGVPHVREANVGSGRLLNVGKAYSGLTDLEISELTEWFKQHTIEDQGYRLIVEPRIVLEVAFNNVMVSDRYESGYALRFPRILRLRPDKPVNEIDTLARVREIYQLQHAANPRPAAGAA